MSEEGKGFDVDALSTKVKEKFAKRKWLVGIGGAIILSGVTYWLAWAIMGAAALMAAILLAGLVGAVAIFMTPVVLSWLEVKQIEMIKHIAANNPIATQWAEYFKDVKETDAVEAALDEYEAGIEVFEGDNNRSKSDLSPDDYKANCDEIVLMKRDLEAQRVEVKEQRTSLSAVKTAIKGYEAQWNLSIKRDALNEKMRRAKSDEMLSKIKKDASFNAIQEAVARRRVQLRKSLRDSAANSKSGIQEIALSPTETLEIPLTQKVQVAQ